MRNIFIGDVHGCFDELQDLLSKLELLDTDKIYFVGDMVNRGPKSYEVLELLFKNDNFFAVKGNHEVGLLLHIDGLAPEYENDEYIKLRAQLSDNSELLEYVRTLPMFIDTPDFLLVHAGVLPGLDIHNQSEQTLTEIYYYEDLPWYMYYPPENKKIIYGHWAENGLQIRSNTIGLDSGCAIGGKLSAYILETEEIVQVPAKKQYLIPKLSGYEAERAKK